MHNPIGVWFYIDDEPLDVRDDGARWMGRRADGYGNRIRTGYVVRWHGRTRRVYVCQWGATGAYYVNVKGSRVRLDVAPVRGGA